MSRQSLLARCEETADFARQFQTPLGILLPPPPVHRERSRFPHSGFFPASDSQFGEDRFYLIPIRHRQGAVVQFLDPAFGICQPAGRDASRRRTWWAGNPVKAKPPPTQR